MATLLQTKSLPSYAYDLFEAIGYTNVEEIVTADAKELESEFKLANSKLHITSEIFNEDVINDWLEKLRVDLPELTSKESVSESESEVEKPNLINYEIVDFENSLEIEQSLANAQNAIRFNHPQNQSNELSIDNIFEGGVISRADGVYRLKIPEDRQQNDEASQNILLKTLSPENQNTKKTVEPANFKAPEEQKIKPLKRRTDRSIVKTSKNLNKGIDPRSRKFAKGVLHPNPNRIKIGAAVTLISILVSVICLTALAYTLNQHKELGTKFNMWLGGIFFTMFITLVLYLRFGVKARCCVCTQRINVTRQCKKHQKAHHIPVIGYIIPTALQLLFYNWFYCMYCGTAIRLKK